MIYIGIPRFIVLCFIVFCRYCVVFFVFFFYKMKVCGSSALSISIGAIFPTASVHFMCLCHILVILGRISNCSIIVTFVMICDLSCCYCKKDYDSLKAQMMVSTF